MRFAMQSVFKLAAASGTALALTLGAASAHAGPGGYGGHGGGHGTVFVRGGGGYHGGYYRGGGYGYWGPGLILGGIGLGLGIAALNSYDYGQPVYVNPQPVVVYAPPPAAPVAAYAPQPAAAPAAAAEPIIYPRNGQSPAQTEADRQACNRWATTVPSAMADASVFQRAVLACMDGRGYTLR